MQTTKITITVPSRDPKKRGIADKPDASVNLYTDGSATIGTRETGTEAPRHLVGVDSAKSLAGALVPAAIIQQAQNVLSGVDQTITYGSAQATTQRLSVTTAALRAILAALDAEVDR